MQFDHKKIKYGTHVQEHVRTNAGNSVIMLCDAQINGRIAIVGLVLLPEQDNHLVNVWELDGSTVLGSNYYLVGTGTKRKLTGWLNIYPEGQAGKFYDNKEDAIRFSNPRAVARIYREIEFEEGEGL